MLKIKYSKELKNEIMNKYLNNQGTLSYISKEYKIPLKNVKTWIYKLNKNIDITTNYNYKKGSDKFSFPLNFLIVVNYSGFTPQRDFL